MVPQKKNPSVLLNNNVMKIFINPDMKYSCVVFVYTFETKQYFRVFTITYLTELSKAKKENMH